MDDSCAADGYASSIYTIAIGSAASDGTQASYDEDCSGKMAVVFISNPHGQDSVVSAWLYLSFDWPSIETCQRPCDSWMLQ